MIRCLWHVVDVSSNIFKSGSGLPGCTCVCPGISIGLFRSLQWYESMSTWSGGPFPMTKGTHDDLGRTGRTWTFVSEHLPWCQASFAQENEGGSEHPGPEAESRGLKASSSELHFSLRYHIRSHQYLSIFLYISHTLSPCFVISQFFRTWLPELRARLPFFLGLSHQPVQHWASQLAGIHHDPIGYVPSPERLPHPFKKTPAAGCRWSR